MTLSKEFIERSEERLLTEKAKIEDELGAYKKELEFGDDSAPHDEEADETEEFATYLGVRRELERRLSFIHKALERIKAGKYGICEQCGGTIEEEVLEAEPESRLCKTCKQR